MRSLIAEFSQHYEVQLIAGSAGPLLEQARELNVSARVVKEIDSFNGLIAIYKLRKILKEEKPDLVHVHSALASFYGRVAAKLCGLKTLYTVHGWHFFDEKTRASRFLKVGIERAFKPFTDRWITVSEFDRNEGLAHSIVDAQRTDVIPNGIASVASFGQARTEGESQFRLVFVGRAARQKNHDSAIRILEQSFKTISLDLYLSGDDVHLDAVEKRIEQSQSKDRLTLYKNDSNAALKLADYSAMLMTSRYEGMPIVALEAMRAGLPIIATNVCGMNEVVEQSVTGYLHAPDDEESMVCSLNALAAAPQSTETMGRMAKRVFSEHFLESLMLQRTMSVYRQFFDPRA